MRVHVESVLDCPPEKAWAEVQTSALLLKVVRPVIQFLPAEGAALPERWQQGMTVRCRVYFLGVLPLGTHTITVVRVDPEAREILTNEHDLLIRRWDHLIRVRDAAGGRTLYSDEIDIDAGPLTPLVWLFAHVFYRHRQRRWRAVAQRLSRT
jgi:hypothetical protein